VGSEGKGTFSEASAQRAYHTLAPPLFFLSFAHSHCHSFVVLLVPAEAESEMVLAGAW